MAKAIKMRLKMFVRGVNTALRSLSNTKHLDGGNNNTSAVIKVLRAHDVKIFNVINLRINSERLFYFSRQGWERFSSMATVWVRIASTAQTTKSWERSFPYSERPAVRCKPPDKFCRRRSAPEHKHAGGLLTLQISAYK